MSQSSAAVSYSGDAETFSADRHFLGLVQRVASGSVITRISLDDHGEVVIDPNLRRYSCALTNPTLFYRSPAASFRVAPNQSVSVLDHGRARDLAELLWIAAYHAANGRLLTGCSKYDVVRLQYWPNLSRLPQSPNTMRLCAFLSRRPSAIHLARKLVGVDEGEAYSFYSAGLSAGALELVSRAPARNQGEPDSAPDNAPEAAPATAAQPSDRSLLRLIWNKVSRL